MKIFNFFKITGLIILLMGVISCGRKEKYYSADDFTIIPKIDAHFHYYSTDGRFVDFAISQHFSLISPNVDTEMSIDEQWQIARGILRSHPSGIAFLGTFSVDGFAGPGFEPATICKINNYLKEGASGIKIWKNIGMELRDSSGRYVMADNPAFEPIYLYLEKNKIPLLAHLGEPRNCWLPVEEMTDNGDRNYYKEHPQYHMYLHPEMPSYEDQISARDRLLEKYPGIVFVGAHLGSLEWNVDELAKRLDHYPNFSVDMAARIGHFKNQSKVDRERVRQFMINYQDRILYATDMSVHDGMVENFENSTRNIRKTWLSDWMYLATDSISGEIRGLKLPSDVIDKIYFRNAMRIFKLNH